MRVVRYKSARLRAISVALLGFAILRYKSARLVFQKRAVTTAHLCTLILYHPTLCMW
jgi:hypothetical protein